MEGESKENAEKLRKSMEQVSPGVIKQLWMACFLFRLLACNQIACHYKRI